MPIEWKPAACQDDRRQDAEERIAARDPDDWPTVALALSLGLPVWSQDKDLASAGLDIRTTGDLLDALRDAGHIDEPAGPLRPARTTGHVPLDALSFPNPEGPTPIPTVRNRHLRSCTSVRSCAFGATPESTTIRFALRSHQPPAGPSIA